MKIKYKVLSLLIYLFILIPLGILIFTAIFPEKITELSGIVMGKTQYGILIGSIILSMGLVKLLTGPMRAAKEALSYDEFGLRNKKQYSKFDMDSKNRKKLEAEATARMEKIMPRDQLRNATKKGSLNPLGELEKMIGMDPVKQKIRSYAARMEFESKSNNHKTKNEGHHMIFYGAPGTGKTTVARIMAGLLYEYGYCSENKCVEFDGNSIKSNNAVETAIKIKTAIRAAYNGVLFIDEAYSLTNSKDAAGTQAVAVLIKEMEDNRDKFTLILAGYTSEMTMMLNTNPGFRSRINEYIQFPDYTIEELTKIAITMAHEKDFVFTTDALEIFKKRMTTEKNMDSWGNGRTVRKVVEECINNHASNYIQNHLEKGMRYAILPEDVSQYTTQTI